MQISDFLVDKYKKFLYLKKQFFFLKKVFDSFLQILAKKSSGSVLFSRDGRVTTNINFSWPNFFVLLNILYLNITFYQLRFTFCDKGYDVQGSSKTEFLEERTPQCSRKPDFLRSSLYLFEKKGEVSAPQFLWVLCYDTDDLKNKLNWGFLPLFRDILSYE